MCRQFWLPGLNLASARKAEPDFRVFGVLVTLLIANIGFSDYLVARVNQEAGCELTVTIDPQTG